jgi:tricorn protease
MKTPRTFRMSLVPLLLALAPAARAQVKPDAVMLRFPDVSVDQIVFRYAGDLWLVAKEGGVARRISSAKGGESFPKFSPDGRRVAFMGSYDGGSDLYVLELGAGVPERVTHHPGQEVLCDWTPDGRDLLFWSSEVSGLRRAPRVLRVPAAGGQPEPLAIPYGTFAAFDADGRWLAYTPGSREFRTWKRYQGGMAQDIWLFDVQTLASRRMTDWTGTDALPMWHGRRVLFLSDRGEGSRLNLYAYDTESGATERLTDFRDFDVLFPSIGPDDVVFTAGPRLYRYELAGGRVVPVDVVIPGERADLRAQTVDVHELMSGASAGPTAVRVAVEARGDVFSVPVEEGVTRNLTRTSGFAERDPEWSPDGRWIAYFSDRSGEYELTLRRADGKTFEGADEHGERRLSSLGPGWKFQPRWSPDSKWIAFTQNDGSLKLCEVASGAVREVTTNPTGEPLEVDWAPDSGWLAWSHRHSESRLEALYLYELASAEVHEVTSGMFDDANPVFDRGGDWLFFHSTRTFDPIYSDVDTTWIYTNSRNLMAVPLRADVENPWAPKDAQEKTPDDEPEASDEADESDESDEEPDDESGEAEEADEAGQDEAADGEEEGEEEEEDADEAPEPVRIDIEGFEGRALIVPVPPGEIGDLAGGEGKVLYVRRPRTGTDGEKAALHVYDLEKDEEKERDATILEDVGGYALSAKGDKVLVAREGALGVVEAKPKQEFEAIDLSGLVATVDPRAEWAQVLRDVHRLFRDFFYDPTMHGIDWDAVYARYAGVLPDVTSRADLTVLIGEMIAELNVGHAYNRAPAAGQDEPDPARPVGLLGCDWELEQGAYRIARILGGRDTYDADARSPLARQGADVRAGDWLLAVNGVPVDTTRDVYAAFVGTAEKPTELTVNASPGFDGEERTVLVEPLRDDTDLRYRDWVAANRAHVEEKGGGRIGYVHVPSTGIDGQNELVRQFLAQMHKDALIVDERWNSGGQIPTRFIELLDRPLSNFWAIRHGEDWDWPPVAHHGPKAMLVNGWAGSGGDAFPYYFRQRGLGKLIGTRTWGGLVGISGNPALVDGARPTVPRFAFYETDGTWGVEGHGVDPDIEVIADPSKMQDGHDVQLQAAIEHLMAELEKNPPQKVKRPPDPDRSGMGIPEEDY